MEDQLSIATELCKFFPLTKVQDDTDGLAIAYGMATDQTPDSDHEVASYPETAAEYQKWAKTSLDSTKAAGQQPSMGNCRLQHGSRIAGKVIAIEYLEQPKEIFVAMKACDQEISNLLRDGFCQGFSHAGRYGRRWHDICNTDMPTGFYCPTCQKTVDKVFYFPVLSEISIVDRPANPHARFEFVRADGHKELRKFVASAAIDVLSDIRVLAERQRQEFSQAIEDLDKAARHPTGRFALHASGEAHDLAAGYGYQHARTGSHDQPGNDATAAKQYTHDSGARLTVRDDGNWNHDDGHGRTASGIGLDTLRNCLMARHPKKMETTDMDDAALEKMITDKISDALAAIQKRDMKCPGCGAEMTVDSDGDGKCAKCGYEMKAGKGVKPKEDDSDKGDGMDNELLKAAKDDLEKTKTEMQKLSADVAGIDGKLDSKLAPIAKALEGLTAIGERLTKLEALNESVTKLETTVGERLTKVEAFGDRLTKAEEEVKKIGEEAAPLAAKVGGLQLFSRDGKQLDMVADNGDDRSGGL
jgi:hypothetical protein